MNYKERMAIDMSMIAGFFLGIFVYVSLNYGFVENLGLFLRLSGVLFLLLIGVAIIHLPEEPEV